MVIIETKVFTKSILELMTDSEYSALQQALIQQPDQAPVIPGSGGLRKLRWATDSAKGKSGGARIIYYWVNTDNQILMLYAYRKAKQENLTQDQLRMLRKIIERW